ncbi:PDZ domain-containing protein [soil metagenome]
MPWLCARGEHPIRPLPEGYPLALFTDTEPTLQPRRRRRIGWLILLVSLVGIASVALIPAPYVIEQPGPVYNVLGDVTVSGHQVPLIDIPTEHTYPTDGALDMLTVSIRGDRQQPPSWFEIATAYFDPSKAVVPVDEIYPAGTSVEQSNQQGQVDMQNSQKEAIAAALTELGYSFPSTLTVVETQPGGPADGKLEAGDTIVSLDGTPYSDVSALRAGIAANGVDKPATIVVDRKGVEQTFQVTPKLSPGDAPAPIVGIVVGSDYTFPIDVTIQLENVGGPSAGQMFALGIIDKLTTGELNGGKNVAGTGTITADGEVGPIGGIRQKLYGARNAGAEYFLAPASNCDEVTGHIPAGLTVFAVKTLDDSLAALKAVSSGGDTSVLPACPAH